MPAYVSRTISEFLRQDATTVLGELQTAYADDGFATQYTRQSKAWATVLPLLNGIFSRLVAARPEASHWGVLLEYPLYRLRRRIDLVLITEDTILVVEYKVGGDAFSSEDRRQVEEYAMDLRDFHFESRGRRILPVLWSTGVDESAVAAFGEDSGNSANVAQVALVGNVGIEKLLLSVRVSANGQRLIRERWDQSRYNPVPNVVEAATLIFSRHDVRSIANADADNLQIAASRILDLIAEAKNSKRRYLLILTGVPGSGKTLAGLDVVHRASAENGMLDSDIVYLSANTPLVTVLREALTLDEKARADRGGMQTRLGDIRRAVRVRIQHINDFLKEGLSSDERPPHEHAIVFDEAQRAWDEKQGMEKFDRTASEPTLILELMSRHRDWCVCVCLVGGGQEINSGEEGILGWGKALASLPDEEHKRWSVFGPPDVIDGDPSLGTFTLGALPADIRVQIDGDLQLRVPQRSFRSPSVSEWVDHVLAGNVCDASRVAGNLNAYPIVLTRSLSAAKLWLRANARGERRSGLLASSGARRLRADGLGEMLDANAGSAIAQWYLKPPGDIRSSFALEVPANEYTAQGLELDFACICWGGDMLWDADAQTWCLSRLSGTAWQRVREKNARRYLKNSYRVLMTRAREGLVLWIPEGDGSDATRLPSTLDATAEYLVGCGALPLVS